MSVQDTYLCNIALDLSPIQTIAEFSGSSFILSLIALAIEEWIPPQRPLSELIAIYKCFGLPSGASTSAFS